MPTVRIVTPGELDRCAELFAAVAEERRWLATEPPVDRREVCARWRDLLDTRLGTLLLAEDGPELVGLSVMVGRDAPELGMLVAAAHRGLGVGSALLAASLDWARAQAAQKVVLHVFPHNAAARALYRAHGFVEVRVAVGAFPRRSGELWDAIRMELRLR